MSGTAPPNTALGVFGRWFGGVAWDVSGDGGGVWCVSMGAMLGKAARGCSGGSKKRQIARQAILFAREQSFEVVHTSRGGASDQGAGCQRLSPASISRRLVVTGPRWEAAGR
ncbi:hypothetical protein GGTG_04394 [Gaeumannomyces tritici R3-111a-1]|uniref:Uncharacterized protein n=1 Tax=Gaeumannomyces tritici (strain R3-111a-1) TaxID=644352 RepID=J3NSZ6_GAET3|nr:hypothetical protein GGTG_04394 [Gaeumannomyces tritici R3-111a-1]EJT79309.1 hypothetical protein GGTG_04394 [Gaeumannomyces tritici R3-111a-1]